MVFGDRSQRDAPPEPPAPAAIAPEVTGDPAVQGRGGELFVWFGTTFDLLALFFILGTVLRFLDVWSASFFAALCALTALILSCLVRSRRGGRRNTVFVVASACIAAAAFLLFVAMTLTSLIFIMADVAAMLVDALE